jgi:hypothetical protein
MAQETAQTTVQSSNEAAFQALTRERRERFVQTMRTVLLIALILTSLPAFAIWGFSPKYAQLLAYAGSNLAMLIPSGLVSPLLHRRGHVTASLYVLLVSIAALAFGSLLLMPEVMTAVGIGYVFLILLGSLGLGARAGRRLAVVLVISFGLNILLAHTLVLGFESLDQTVGQIFGAIMGIVAVTALAFMDRWEPR